jgi:signal transduction histidine kinase
MTVSWLPLRTRVRAMTRLATPPAPLPDEGTWRRGVLLLGAASAAVLVLGLASHLGEPLVAAVLALGLACWLLELFRTPEHIWQEAALLVVTGICGGVLNALVNESSGFLLAYLAAAGLGLRIPLRQAIPALVAVIVALDVGVVTALPHVVTSLTTDDLGVAFTFVVAAATRNARFEHARSAQLLAQLEAARGAEARAAALAERARLAREIHDILAHALSGQVMSLEATKLLAERTGADPRVVEQVERAHRLAKDGLADTRRAVGALRGDLLPGPDRLPDLVDEARSAHGVLATLTVHGEARPLSAEAGLTVYRAAQEALTNTAKHAGRGATLDITLTWASQELELLAVDRPRSAPPQMPASGYGLTGLRERAELAGGMLEARPTADGFELRLVLPYEHEGSLR